MPDSFLHGLPVGTFSSVIGGSALLLFIYFTLWFLVTEALHNGGLVDIGWGAGFVLLAGWRMLIAPSFPSVLMWIAVASWGLRLAVHIGRRNIGKPEDPRYAGFRQEWGKKYPLRAYLQLFLFQGLMMGLISLPFLLGLEAYRSGAVLSVPVFVAGLLVFWFGLGYETTADRELAKFLAHKENRGTLMRTGLWAWSRHPNYFGESVAWWGIYSISISMGAPWWTFVGPLTITLLLRFVSGVPLLEKRMAGRSGFSEYAASTPIFIPRRPRKE